VFKRFFGKKNDGFYIQLEDEDAKSAPAAKAPAKSEPAATVTATKAAEPAVAVSAATVDTKPAKVDAKSAKAEKKKSAKKAETPKVEAAPAPVAPPAPAITNFATDYLIKPSSDSGRRRPGANMRQFMDLARQMEKPKAFKATAAERKPSAEKPPAPSSKEPMFIDN
jgi:hypothetical protein